jgi:G2/mitotic-specific cyclin 1/2
MTEQGYNKEEILKGERIILQTLDFEISSYCSPYSWVRRISKADDYDIQTRTLSKFLMEVTLLDHRFLRCKPSMVAAIGMYLARRMLNGTWVSIPYTDENQLTGRTTHSSTIPTTPNLNSYLEPCYSVNDLSKPISSLSMSTRNTPTRSSCEHRLSLGIGHRPTLPTTGNSSASPPEQLPTATTRKPKPF